MRMLCTGILCATVWWMTSLVRVGGRLGIWSTGMHLPSSDPFGVRHATIIGRRLALRETTESLLISAQIDAPLLAAAVGSFASASVTLPAEVGRAAYDTSVARCDAAALASETLPLRHPDERRLLVLSCGGVATTYIMKELTTSLAPYGYTTNCGEADMAHFKHRFPDEAADPTLMEQLYCYEPDRIIYLFSDALPSIMSVHRRGHVSCGGMQDVWDPSMSTSFENELLARNMSHVVHALDVRRYDFIGRSLHQTGWAVANVPAPLLFVNTATVFDDPSLLTDFLAVPAGVLNHLAPRARTSVITPATLPYGSPMRQMYANVNRQQRLMDRHLVVPEHFVDRLRSVARLPELPASIPRSAPPPPLQCPAQPSMPRTAVNPAALPGLLTPSRALLQYPDVEPYCGAAWRSIITAYSAFHTRARADLLAAHAAGTQRSTHDLPKVVVWRCPVGNTVHGCGGLGDRMIGMASVFAYALAFQRVILLDLVQAALPFLPAIPGIDWHFDARLVEGRAAKEFFLFNCNTAMNKAPCLWNDAWPDAQLDAEVAYVTTNRGFMGGKQAYSPLKRLGLSPPIAAMCLYHAMWRPAPHFVRRVGKALAGAGVNVHNPLAPRPVVVGVHFRVGDDVMSLDAGGNTTATRDFVATRHAAMQDAVSGCVARTLATLTAAGKQYHVFVMGDSAKVRTAIAANITAGLPPDAPRPGYTIIADSPLHVEPVVYSNRHGVAPAVDVAMDAAFLEWLALSAADLQVSTISGYSRTAWAFSGKNYAVLATRNYVFNEAPTMLCEIASLPTLAVDPLAAGV